MERYYTVQEAREVLRMAESTVRSYLKAGSLKGQKIGRRWKIPESAIREFLSTNGGTEPAGGDGQ